MQSANDAEENKPITVIYEDDDVLVINKPSGVSVHNDAHHNDETVADWFLKRHPQAKGVGESQTLQNGAPMERSGVVHRLDRDTSGVMILAKHQSAYEHLKYQFKQRAAKKEYRAFVYGAMKDRWGTIDRPIGRSGKEFKLRSAEPGARGVLRPAVTHFECIGQSHTHAYLKLLPQTGRMHQLRVHLKAIGRPIVMDPLYAPAAFLTEKSNLGFTRLALHAHRLELVLPSGREERFIAPLPMVFEKAAEQLLEDIGE